MKGGTDRQDRRADLEMVGIVVQDPLQDFGVHQGPIEESRGHGISGEVAALRGFDPSLFFGYLFDDQGVLYYCLSHTD